MFIICSMLSRLPHQLLVAFILASMVGCAPDYGPPEAKALFDRLENDPGAVPARVALGMPDATFVCVSQYFTVQDSVNQLRRSFDDPIPDSKIKNPYKRDQAWTYVVAPSGERLIAADSFRRSVNVLLSDNCVRAETAWFQREHYDTVWALHGDEGRLEGFRESQEADRQRRRADREAERKRKADVGDPVR
jgi:hypothetical protein